MARRAGLRSAASALCLCHVLLSLGFVVCSLLLVLLLSILLTLTASRLGQPALAKPAYRTASVAVSVTRAQCQLLTLQACLCAGGCCSADSSASESSANLAFMRARRYSMSDLPASCTSPGFAGGSAPAYVKQSAQYKRGHALSSRALLLSSCTTRSASQSNSP